MLIGRGQRVLLDVRGRAEGAGRVRRRGRGVMTLRGGAIPLIGKRFGVAVSNVAQRDAVSYLVSPLLAPALSFQLPPPCADGVGGGIEAARDAAASASNALLLLLPQC